MSVASLTMLIIAGFLVGTGVYLLLERTLSRIFIGLSLITHGVNVLILAGGGAAGRPPLLGSEDPTAMADPLPQAMILTSIVLSLGTTAFGLALAYRSWRLLGHDEVVDDVEDRLLARRTEAEITEAQDVASSGDEDEDINYDEASQSDGDEDARGDEYAKDDNGDEDGSSSTDSSPEFSTGTANTEEARP